MSWFDTHCHLQTFLQGQELEAILKRAEEAGVTKMVTVGTCPKDWKVYEKLAQEYTERVYYSVGLHPGYVDENWMDELLSIRNFWKNDHTPVALGESGLDYFRLPKDRAEAEKTIYFQKRGVSFTIEDRKRSRLPCYHSFTFPLLMIVSQKLTNLVWTGKKLYFIALARGCGDSEIN